MELISKQDAVKQGLKNYVKAEPCLNNHSPCQRSVKTGNCCECMRVAKKKIYHDKNAYHPGWEEPRRAAFERKEKTFISTCACPFNHFPCIRRTDKNKCVDCQKQDTIINAERNRKTQHARRQKPEVKARLKDLKKGYVAADPGKYSAQGRTRYVARTRGSPLGSWVIEIKQIYRKRSVTTKSTGRVHHVDHILPLKNDFISGLHVPWNLQILEASENCRKNNSFDESLGIWHEAEYYLKGWIPVVP